jgi:hypothetical protein
MAAKLTRLTHKIAIQLQWQRAVTFAVLAPGGQSGSFWIHSRTPTPPYAFKAWYLVKYREKLALPLTFTILFLVLVF